MALAASERGFGGTISHEWKTFRQPQFDPLFSPNHLVTTNSGNRWVWWGEAAGAWSDRPLQGWGAGSFPVLHLEYRTNDLNVLQPHSVPLQLLAETGLVGALLALGGLVALAVAAVRRVLALPAAAPGDGPAARPTPAGDPSRLLAAALAAAALAWLVHGVYDWDLDIPGASIPAFAFLGVLAGRARLDGTLPPIAPGVRAAALTLVTLAASAVALSAIVPSWANSKTKHALAVADAHHGRAALQRAAAEAELAARLDPVSEQPLLALAAIDQARGQPLAARAAVLRAIRRTPTSAAAWGELVGIEVRLRDLRGVTAALTRALSLDPRNVIIRQGVTSLTVQLSPPSGSATATGTPLPATGVPTLGGGGTGGAGATGTSGAAGAP